METIDALLQAAESPHWAERVRAGQALAALAGEVQVDAALLRLLDDPANTMVPLATGRALLMAAEPAATRVFALAYQTGRNEDAGLELTSALRTTEGLPLELGPLLDALNNDPDKDVREGAAEARQEARLGW